MHQPMSEIAVVREDEKPFGLRVEPPDIEEARKLRRQEIENRVARIGICPGRNEAGWFVQDDMDLVLAAHQLAPHFDVIILCRLHAEVGADAAVDCDASLRD